MSAASVAFSGFALGLSLILAVGAQNAFVLRQGLRGEHVALVCLTCALSDAVLLGSVSTRYTGQRVAFGARLLAPVFARPGAWRTPDASVGLLMLALGASLLQG